METKRNFNGKVADLMSARMDVYTNFGDRWGDGKRSFNIIPTASDLKALKEAGWPVKTRECEDGDIPIEYVTVKFRFWPKRDDGSKDSRTPNIFVVTFNDGKKKITSKNQLTAGEIDRFSSSDIDYVDARISRRDFNFAGKRGQTVDLVSIYIVLKENPLFSKWGLPEEFNDFQMDVTDGDVEGSDPLPF